MTGRADDVMVDLMTPVDGQGGEMVEGDDYNATTTIKTTKHKDTKCPVKIFVYDLGFRNKTSELKKIKNKSFQM